MRHRRSLLLGAVLVLAIVAAGRLIVAHPSLLQISGLEWLPAQPAATQILPRAPLGAGGEAGAAPASIDATPTGSIGPSSANRDASPGRPPATPDLTTAIPSAAPPSLREAVLAGSPAAQYDLAQRLLEGRGFSQDQAAAAFWFDRAASAGFAPAEFRLGALYQKGVGVQRDSAAARRWYTAAARSGNVRAAHNLGVMDAEPVGEKADYSEAAKWFRRAAEMGVRDSQFNLAVLYARGLGVEQDLRQSWMWFSLAAAQGDSEAARKRDEVAAKMDAAALAAAADQLSKFKAVAPDPAANDAPPGDAADKVPADPAAPARPIAHDAGSGSSAGADEAARRSRAGFEPFQSVAGDFPGGAVPSRLEVRTGLASRVGPDVQTQGAGAQSADDVEPKSTPTREKGRPLAFSAFSRGCASATRLPPGLAVFGRMEELKEEKSGRSLCARVGWLKAAGRRRAERIANVHSAGPPRIRIPEKISARTVWNVPTCHSDHVKENII